jgi:hypothetical protein
LYLFHVNYTKIDILSKLRRKFLKRKFSMISDIKNL